MSVDPNRPLSLISSLVKWIIRGVSVWIQSVLMSKIIELELV